VDLFAIRHLAAGREAPNIEDPDQDGREIQVERLRGKVVLLALWAEFRPIFEGQLERLIKGPKGNGTGL